MDEQRNDPAFPRWLLVVLLFGVVLVVLSSVEAISKEYPLKGFVEILVHHVILVAIATLVGAILLTIAQESLERHLVSLIKNGLAQLGGKLQTAVKAPVDGIGDILKDGFRNIASTLAAEVHRFPEAWKSLSDSQVRADLIDKVKHPEARHLAEAGRIQDAIVALDSLVKDQNKIEGEIALYVLSDEEKDWAKALDLIRTNEIRNPAFLITLAHRFWSVGQLKEAIELGREALSLALEAGDETQVSKAKNSLAYYLTDTEDTVYEKMARQYASEARRIRPNSAVLDTEGFVKITFGKSREEIMEGVELCEAARKMGAPFEAYVKHINKAKNRLEQLPEISPGQGSSSSQSPPPTG